MSLRVASYTKQIVNGQVNEIDQCLFYDSEEQAVSAYHYFLSSSYVNDNLIQFGAIILDDNMVCYNGMHEKYVRPLSVLDGDT